LSVLTQREGIALFSQKGGAGMKRNYLFWLGILVFSFFMAYPPFRN